MCCLPTWYREYEYCISFLTVLLHERSKNLHSQKSKCSDTQVRKLHSSFNQKHQQQRLLGSVVLKKSLTKQLCNKFLLKHWITEERHRDLLINTHLAKNTWDRFYVSRSNTDTSTNSWWPCACTCLYMSHNNIINWRLILLCAMLQAILKCYGCKVKHSKSRYFKLPVQPCHISYIHYNTSIKYTITEYFSLCISLGSCNTSGINCRCVMKTGVCRIFVRYLSPFTENAEKCTVKAVEHFTEELSIFSLYLLLYLLLQHRSDHFNQIFSWWQLTVISISVKSHLRFSESWSAEMLNSKDLKQCTKEKVLRIKLYT